jgi:hypothetical protein
VKKEVEIIRLSEILEMLDTVEENVSSIEPPQSKEFIKGMVSGITVAKKLAERIAYQAYEYDTFGPEKESANA